MIAAALWFASAALSVVGWGLRNQQAWARVPAGVLAVVGSLVLLSGVLVNPFWALIMSVACASAAYSMTEEDIARVLSDEYAAAVRATSQSGWRAPDWLVLTVITVCFVALLALSALSSTVSESTSDVEPTANDAQLGAWEESCVGGDALACHNAAVQYDFAQGDARDPGRAAALYERGCNAGAVVSCVNLGTLLAQGDGVESDHGLAEALFVRGCDHGIEDGCENLRRLHRLSLDPPNEN